MGGFSIWHWLIVLVVVLLVFGTKRLTSGARDLGKAVNEFKKRHEWVLNPTSAKWAQQLSSLNFMFYLGLTPAAAVVYLSQTAITTYPVLASRYGAMKAMGMTIEAVKQAATRAIRTYREKPQTGAGPLKETATSNSGGSQ